MALHNYVYLKHREHDSSCHRLLVREKDIVLPRGAVRPCQKQTSAEVAEAGQPGSGSEAQATVPATAESMAAQKS